MLRASTRPLTGALLAATALLLAPAPSARSAQIEPLPLRALARRALAVVVGRATSRRTEVDERGQPWTLVRLRVERVAHDRTTSFRSGGWFEVALLGGVLGDRVMRVPGEARLPDGARILLFLWRDGHGRWRPLGMARGALSIYESPDGTAWVEPPSSAPSAHGGVRSRVPATPSPWPLEVALARIAHWAREAAR